MRTVMVTVRVWHISIGVREALVANSSVSGSSTWEKRGPLVRQICPAQPCASSRRLVRSSQLTTSAMNLMITHSPGSMTGRNQVVVWPEVMGCTPATESYREAIVELK